MGVSIALAANSWYEDRVERGLERAALVQLRAELQADLADIRQNHEDLAEFDVYISRLLEHARGDEPYDDELQHYFVGLTSWRTVRVRLASYEEINNYGFSLISDPILRARVIDLYEGQYPALIGASNVDAEFSRTRIAPYMYENFIRAAFDSDADSGWIPLDYERTRADSVYANTIIAKQSRLRGRLLPRHESLGQSISEIIAMIDKHLSRGR